MAIWRMCLAGLAAASMLALTGCGNREPEQRAAFIQLLQSRIDAGALVPIGKLSDTEKDAVGVYDDAYAVITRFQESMAKAAAPLRQVMAAEAIRSVNDIMQRRQAFEAARKTLADSAGDLQTARAKADQARSGLALPPDLAPVYDGVYDEAVTAPANELMQAAGTLDAVARDALGVADFVAAHAADITLEDDQAKVATPSLQQALNQRLLDLNARAVALEQARATVQRAAGGAS